MAYHYYHKVETRVVRIFNTFGPRMRIDDGRAIPNFFCQAVKGEDLTVFGDGSQTRSFCYYTDLIDGIYGLLMSKENQPVNIGNPEEMTLISIAKKIVSVTKSSSKITFKPLPVDDPRTRQPDITKAKEIFNWFPKVSLDQGLKNTLEYFKSRV
jgi:dTDP-glucose 4,6-dehydratase